MNRSFYFEGVRGEFCGWDMKLGGGDVELYRGGDETVLVVGYDPIDISPYWFEDGSLVGYRGTNIQMLGSNRELLTFSFSCFKDKNNNKISMGLLDENGKMWHSDFILEQPAVENFNVELGGAID